MSLHAFSGNETKETEVFSCPENYIKCPGNYCIPIHYICDGQWHCPNGEDEVSCCKYNILYFGHSYPMKFIFQYP